MTFAAKPIGAPSRQTHERELRAIRSKRLNGLSGRWPPERDAALREFWEAGDTASEIAAKIGEGMSRSAVLGRIHRLGLPGRINPLVVRQPKTFTGEAPKRGRTGSGPGRTLRTLLAPKPDALKERIIVQPPLSRLVTLGDLEGFHCKWPVGNPSQETFRYCAADKEEQGPYCAFHKLIAVSHEHKSRRP